jgi:predicted  nucleic acid-binding Zn-ribbon protein
MANKESLALYLCQTGTVYCKFVITVVNTLPDDSICNEGTQRFSSASTENDWGFNSVVKFDTLLDPKNGFWSENDSIVIEVGIVFVEAPKVQPGKPPSSKPKTEPRPDQRINEDIAAQLLESERLENLRKKIKQDLAKTVKEEEKTRKELVQRAQKLMGDAFDSCRSEKQRIVKEQQERERKEQQERLREQERIRQAQELSNEMRRRIAEYTDEAATLASKKKAVSSEINETKKSIDAIKKKIMEAEEGIGELQQKAHYQKRQLDKAQKVLDEAVAAEPETPRELELGEGANVCDDDDGSDIMHQLRESLAGILNA